MLYQVDIGYACFGVEVRNGIVVEAAPIGGWMIRKPWKTVKVWIKKREGTILKCGEEK